jgi:RNA polymerase sigma-70 factor (ECF subfamily)
MAPAPAREMFRDAFPRLYREHHARLHAHIHRLCGEPDLAADIVQEAFVRLHRRGRAPDSTGAWLVTVANNLLRNALTQRARRLQLVRVQAQVETNDALAADNAAVLDEERNRVRTALLRLAPRDQQLLSLLAGGYRYREMAAALGLNEASVGTLLSRAKRAFREAYGDVDDAP